MFVLSTLDIHTHTHIYTLTHTHTHTRTHAHTHARTHAQIYIEMYIYICLWKNYADRMSKRTRRPKEQWIIYLFSRKKLCNTGLVQKRALQHRLFSEKSPTTWGSFSKRTWQRAAREVILKSGKLLCSIQEVSTLYGKFALWVWTISCRNEFQRWSIIRGATFFICPIS